MYAADNEGMLPPYNNVIGARWNGAAWPDQGEKLTAALRSYLRSGDVWFCPSDRFARSTSNEGALDHRFGSFHYHLTVFKGWTPAPLDASYMTRDGLFSWTPSNLALLSDNLWGCKENEQNEDESRYSHGGRHQAVFLDGHVETYRWEDGRQFTMVKGKVRGKGCVALSY
jgi:prepilin-type processing-associated H-X9-DG protein